MGSTILPVLSMVLPWAAAAAGEEELAPYQQQVVVETSMGSFVLEVFPEAAPGHADAFLRRVESGFYQGTVFHRAIPMGIIQGGDPISRDPTHWDQYGTGGLNERPFEQSPLSHRRGTISVVLVPDQPASGGSQFFICVTDQTQLDGQYTAFARVVEGFEVIEKISLLANPENDRLSERVEILATTFRNRPPPEVIPFLDASPAELAEFRALIQTPQGEIEIEFYPRDALEHVRQFLRFAELGLYDGTTFHRVVPGFVIQGGNISTRNPPSPERYRSWLRPLKSEFNRRKHLPGAVSMARGEDPDSGMDSFFIVLEPQPALDGRYTVFGQVIRGFEVVEAISWVPLAGESPVRPIPMRVRVIEP